MQSDGMKSQWKSSYLFGNNADFVEDLYESYIENPDSVDVSWKKYFDSLQDGKSHDVAHSLIRDKFAIITQHPKAVSGGGGISQAQIKVWDLVLAYRNIGTQMADLDPLKRIAITRPKLLDLAYYGLTDQLENEFYFDNDLSVAKKYKLKDIIAKMEHSYCSTISLEYDYVTDASQHAWLKEQMESEYPVFKLSDQEKLQALQKLAEADGLERYLNTQYVGQKRFSIEGGDSLIPALDRLLWQSAKIGVQEVLIGIAHRGRLNTLVNIAGKSPQKLFAEFSGEYPQNTFVTSGDVKYHKGYKCKYKVETGYVTTTVLYNPSHLELVNPVLNGAVRARQDVLTNPDLVTGVIIHGDSAFIGLGTNQGVFNMSQTRAYGIGGIIHIVVNNQVGFTTSDPHDTRSSRYCTDLAKMIEAPVIHVNADDVDNVLFAVDLAIQYKAKFKKDILIDMVCYRKYGHNEADDPTLTQPFMYRKVKQHIGTHKIYAAKLVAANIITDAKVDEMSENYRTCLTRGEHQFASNMLPLAWYDDKEIKRIEKASLFEEVKTAISKKQLADVVPALTTPPAAPFKLHSTVARVVEARKLMAQGEQAVDYGMAENLAYATLLQQGVNVRMSGEDSRRGTFSHRHAVWHDFAIPDMDDDGYMPLKELEKDSRCSIFDSVLNEECVLGFEYGYGMTNFRDLVIWEAQFGDFANGAQAVIDQFIISCEAKWGILANIVLMLPHGYDGQGPEHSSARLERYLQLCAENNLQVVIPTTAAQIFHLLRHQALSDKVKPMALLLSKRLLRYKDAASDISEFMSGKFNYVMPDQLANAAKVKYVYVCTGQVYYDLNQIRVESERHDVAIIRVEQLYPFPVEHLNVELSKYSKAKRFVWVQEEPYNQGAWIQIRDYLDQALADKNQKFDSVSRVASAAPACGLPTMHNAQLQDILKKAFTK